MRHKNTTVPQKTFRLPYGHGYLEFSFAENPERCSVILPNGSLNKVPDAKKSINQALSSPMGIKDPFAGISEFTKIAISINDKTRPVPNSVLLPPLLARLQSCGVPNQNITIFIASGTHTPMTAGEFKLTLSREIIENYRIIAHNCDDKDKLYALGTTFRNTPVLVNSEFYRNDLKIVVGDIEPHHFAGYSGGVKSAAIGLAGRKTINANHKLLIDENSVIGSYDQNPLRLDIEEIGTMMKVDLALNAVLNECREIIGVFFGKPSDVMKAGLALVDQISRVHLDKLYDIVIASAGGYPKDINLYQAQKAMTHAALFCKPGGIIVLVAECVEGVGSDGYLSFMNGITNVSEVVDKFKNSDFMVGPHKAFQIARILEKHQVYLYSSLPPGLVTSLLMKPIEQFGKIQELIGADPEAEVAILPHATACIATLEKESND